MTRAEFRTLVQAYVAFDGKTQLSATSDWDTAINDGLEAFSEATWCLYSDTIDIISSAGSPTTKGWLYGEDPLFDLMDTGFYNADNQGYARRVFYPTGCVVADRPLRRLDGRIGLISFAEMQALDPYGTARVAVGDIKFACRVHPHHLRIFPRALETINDSAIQTGVIPGFYLHPRLSNDAHNVYVPTAYQRTSAAFVAAQILTVRGSASVMERMRALEAAEAARMSALVAKAMKMVREDLMDDYAPILPLTAQVAAEVAA